MTCTGQFNFDRAFQAWKSLCRWIFRTEKRLFQFFGSSPIFCKRELKSNFCCCCQEVFISSDILKLISQNYVMVCLPIVIHVYQSIRSKYGAAMESHTSRSTHLDAAEHRLPPREPTKTNKNAAIDACYIYPFHMAFVKRLRIHNIDTHSVHFHTDTQKHLTVKL